jgi:hypothetical protein
MITEGMRGADLEDMVLPLISVDEYQSKVDDSAVVFGFYVNDRDAANDLNRFIQKSPTNLLDTEVSPAPDQNGYYDRLAQNVRELLDEVEPLTNNTAWQLRIRGVERLVPFSVSALKAHLTDQEAVEDDEKKTVEEQVLTFLQPSGLSKTGAENNRLFIEGSGDQIEFEIVDFGPTERLLAEHDLGSMGMTLRDAAYEMRIALMLGDGWAVHRMGDVSVFLHECSENALFLKQS